MIFHLKYDKGIRYALHLYWIVLLKKSMRQVVDFFCHLDLMTYLFECPIYVMPTFHCPFGHYINWLPKKCCQVIIGIIIFLVGINSFTSLQNCKYEYALQIIVKFYKDLSSFYYAQGSGIFTDNSSRKFYTTPFDILTKVI